MLDRTSPGLSRTKKLVFAFVPLLLFLGSTELLIRLTDAAESCPASAQPATLVCDPLLRFKNDPKLVVFGEPLNHAGFRGREFLPKTPGTFRILALGDSCTFGIVAPNLGLFVRAPYPRLLERSIERARDPGSVEVLNAGTPGYNSYQGLMLLRTKLRDLKPDLITVRFGWNDHLMSSMGREEGAFRESGNPFVRSFHAALLRTALYPFAIRLSLEARSALSGDQPAASRFPREWKPNMSIPEYQYALRSIAELGHSMGARVWFLTSPDAGSNDRDLERYEALPRGAQARKLLFFNALPSFARMREVHDRYNEAARSLARELDVRLVDMDALYRKSDDPSLFSIEDFVHPTQRGHRLEAKILSQQLLGSGVLDDPSAVAGIP